MATLYRTYRPQRFADLVNQQHIRLTLQNALQQDRVAHAYLFAGPRGVGKTTVARVLARALNCQNRGKDGEPCNQCETCQAMMSNASLDILEVDAASQTGVDNVRDNIIQSARTSPTVGKFKVFIIDEVHMLSLAAFNALLKLLEEPPVHAVFVLATTEVHRVPETIISRTQRFDFKKIGIAEIVQRLEWLTRQEKRSLASGIAERIARAAGGSLRDAESMLGQLFSFEQKEITTELADVVLPRSDQATISGIITHVAAGRAKEALDVFHKFCDDGGDISTLAHDLVRHCRVMLMLSLDATLLSTVMDEVDQHTGKELLSLGQQVGTPRCVAMVEGFLDAERQLQRASFEELPVEVAIIKLCIDSSSGGLPAAETSVSSRPTSVPAAPVETKTATTPKPRRQKTGSLSLADVQSAWKSVQSTVANPSLKISLQHAEVVEVADSAVTITVPFQLHADRLADPKHQTALLDLLKTKLGQSVTLNIRRSGSAPVPPAIPTKVEPKPASQPKGDLWDQIVSEFQ